MEAGCRYFPRGTNILLCPIMGDFYDRLSEMSEQVCNLLVVVWSPRGKLSYSSILTQRKARNVPNRGFGCLELCLYGRRELAEQHVVTRLGLQPWAVRPLDMNHLQHHLQAPLGHLYFAGEALSEDYYGTLHGALDRSVIVIMIMMIMIIFNDKDHNNNDCSGEKTADQLVDCLTGLRCP